MSAQLASNAVLSYGPQGSRQAATSALLSYGGAVGRRRLTTSFTAPWSVSKPRALETRAPMRSAAARDTERRAPWLQGRAQQSERRAPWVRTILLDTERGASWGRYSGRPMLVAVAPWPTAHTAERGATAPWGRYAGRIVLTAAAPWVLARVSDPQATAPWGRYTGRPALTALAPWSRGRSADADRCIPWVRFGRPLDAGWGVITPPGSVEDPLYVIPVLKVYMTVHTITAQLLPSMTPVPLQGATIEASDGGFGWSLNADGPESLLDQLAPVSGLPARIRVEIDGISWVFAVERIGRTRRFAQHRVSIQGRSVTALLGDPYMPRQSWLSAVPYTAQQLVARALEFTGTTMDWGITDWLVPAGAWSFQGTPLQAAQRVAESVGAVLRSHRTDARLIFAPRYPALPWQWASTPVDVQMPAAIIASDELQPDPRPAYNALYVSGMAQGVLGHVRRTGTAGDLLAPQVTDALITHETAARQRGGAVLGAAGNKLTQTITVPLLTGALGPGLIAPGLIEPGRLLEVTDIGTTWRGLVRGVRITAGMPTVRQTLTVERSA